MPFDREIPDPYKPGDRFPSSADLNKIRESGLRRVGGPGVSNYGQRVNVNQPADQPGLPDHRFFVDEFVVRDVFDDYLLCVPLTFEARDTGWWDSIGYDADRGEDLEAYYGTYVAKPPHLRRSFYDGKTFVLYAVPVTYNYVNANTRNAVRAAGTETENLSVPYFAGDVIKVVRGVTGLVNPTAKPILWTDINAAGRFWGEMYPVNTVLSWTQVIGEATGLYWPAVLIADTISGPIIGNPVRLKPLGGEPLEVGDYYLATKTGYKVSGVDVWNPVVTCCESICCPLPDTMCAHLVYSDSAGNALEVYITLEYQESAPSYFGGGFPWADSGGGAGVSIAASLVDKWYGYYDLGDGWKLYVSVARLISDPCQVQAFGWVERYDGVLYGDFEPDGTGDIEASSFMAWNDNVNDGCSLPLDTDGAGVPEGGPGGGQVGIFAPWVNWMTGIGGVILIYPHIVITGGECSPTSGSGSVGIPGTYPSECSGTEAFCITVDGALITVTDATSGAGIYYESAGGYPSWSLGFSDTDPPSVLYNSGTGLYAVFHLNGDFTCGAGGNFVKVYDNIGLTFNTISVASGACP